MKKYFFVAAIAAMSLASCSNDDVIEVKQDEIKFNVVTNRASRAANIYCNNNMPEDFKVYAFYNNGTQDMLYIDGDVITRSENGVYVNSTNKSRFWPETSLDFVALKNFTNGATLHYHAQGAYYGHVSENFTVAQNVADQIDLLYAIAPAQTKEIAKDGVKLNFRHALSQVVFKAKNLNSALHVEVTGVKVGNVANKGQFDITLKNSTEGNYNIHEEGYDFIEDRNHWRAYNTSTTGNSDFEVLLDAPVVLSSTTQSLTSANAEGKEFSNTAMLMIPQTTTAWDIEKTSNPDEGYALNEAGTTMGYGTYLAIKCTIWNVAGEEYNAESDLKLYDGWAYIPADFNWKEGKKYTYTFIINDGAGFDDKGIPTLHKITYSVTVDDFESWNQSMDMSTFE